MVRRTMGRRIAVGLVLLTPVLAAGVARTMGIRPVQVVSSSMAPTVEAGEWIVVADLRRGPWSPSVHRGDAVLFEYPEGTGRHAMKRVVALPGDRVEVAADSITVNGERRPLEVAAEVSTPTTVRVTLVPPNSVYLVGDNSARSIDSRTLGPVANDRLTAKVLLAGGTTTDVLLGAAGPTVIGLGIALGAVGRRRRRSGTADPLRTVSGSVDQPTSAGASLPPKPAVP